MKPCAWALAAVAAAFLGWCSWLVLYPHEKTEKERCEARAEYEYDCYCLKRNTPESEKRYGRSH